MAILLIHLVHSSVVPTQRHDNPSGPLENVDGPTDPSSLSKDSFEMSVSVVEMWAVCSMAAKAVDAGSCFCITQKKYGDETK